MKPRRFVALDRDGTLTVEKNYLSDPAGVELLGGAVAGLLAMRALGLGIVVVTNQSGIARGYYDEKQLAAIHARLNDLLAAAGVSVDGIYYCPHGPEDACPCRKPEPGMLLQAAAEHGFSPAECFVIGDKPCDVDLGRRVGATTFLVRTGYGAQFAAAGDIGAHHVVDDLQQAAAVIAGLLR